jgi:hypothetical protein
MKLKDVTGLINDVFRQSKIQKNTRLSMYGTETQIIKTRQFHKYSCWDEILKLGQKIYMERLQANWNILNELNIGSVLIKI